MTSKQLEYRYFLRKGCLIAYYLINLKPSCIKEIVATYLNFEKIIEDGKGRFREYDSRLSDIDTLLNDALRYFLTQLTTNAVMKYASEDPVEARDAYLSLKLGIYLSL